MEPTMILYDGLLLCITSAEHMQNNIKDLRNLLVLHIKNTENASRSCWKPRRAHHHPKVWK